MLFDPCTSKIKLYEVAAPDDASDYADDKVLKPLQNEIIGSISVSKNSHAERHPVQES